MKRIQPPLSLSLALASAMLLSCAPSGPAVPAHLEDYAELYRENPREANLQWFTDAKFGLFMHYGLYSQLGKGEWVQFTERIPVAEYVELTETFNPENFDPEAIVDLAESTGMKYITITSKHHDGFALFDTDQNDYDAPTAVGRDLIGELYEECVERGMGIFLYYSYATDWHHPYFYPREEGWNAARPNYDEPQPEYLYESPEDFTKYVEFAHAQIRELLTRYPEIAGVWFDPIMGYYANPELFPIDETYALVRELSPHALISFKQGANGEEDFVAPERDGSARVGEQYEVARIAYEKNLGKPREVSETMQPKLPGMSGGATWGYNASIDDKHLTADQVMERLREARENGWNFLLNVGPLPDGSIHPEDIASLTEVGRRLAEDPLK